MFRKAEATDADALARIYNQAISPETCVTGQVQQVSRQERLAWLEKLRPPFGAWVIEKEPGDILGWFSLGVFAVRPHLPGIAEVSVYVDELHRSGRIGALLLAYLVDEARRAGFRSLVTIASERNTASITGCVAYGFRPVATLYEIARLGGSLENATWLQKDLRVDDPPQFRRIRDSFLKSVGRDVPTNT